MKINKNKESILEESDTLFFLSLIISFFLLHTFSFSFNINNNYPHVYKVKASRPEQ